MFLFILDCSSLNILDTLPTGMFCSVSSTCSKIDCCMTDNTLRKNIEFGMEIGICNNTVTVYVERYLMKRNFEDYTWGKMFIVFYS